MFPRSWTRANENPVCEKYSTTDITSWATVTTPKSTGDRILASTNVRRTLATCRATVAAPPQSPASSTRLDRAATSVSE